jgi:hypothetical protein
LNVRIAAKNKKSITMMVAILPKMSNQWIYLLGEMPVDYLAGWGDTPYSAMQDFVHNFYNEKAQKEKDERRDE